jgi:hypothetical protein
MRTLTKQKRIEEEIKEKEKEKEKEKGKKDLNGLQGNYLGLMKNEIVTTVVNIKHIDFSLTKKFFAIIFLFLDCT